MAIQSFDEWQKSQKTIQTPQIPTSSTEKTGGLLERIGSGLNTVKNIIPSPIRTTIGDILQGIEYPIGGYLSGTYKKSQELVPQVKSGQMGKPEAILRALTSGFSGIIPGIQNRTTISNYLDQVKELTPAQKFAIGLPASLAIPSIPISKISKATGLTKLVGNTLSKIKETPISLGKYGTKVGELFIPRYGQPKQYAEMAKDVTAQISKASERGVEIAKPIAKLSSDTQNLITKMMRKEIPITPEMEAVVKPAIEEFNKWGQEAVREGLLDEKLFSKWGPLFELLPENKKATGYLPRLYRLFEDGTKKVKDIGKFTEYKPNRLDLSRFMERKDIPEEIRKAMGEITEAGYPTAKGISQIAETVTRSKFFRKIAENTEWASDIAKEGFEKLPKSEKLGKLSEKYVLAPIAHDIQDWIAVKGVPEQLLNKVTGWWKYSKVILNPATHFRNMASNVVQAYTNAGLNPARVDIYASALSDLVKKGPDYQEAKNLGLMGSTYYGQEIKSMLDGFDKNKGIISSIGNFLKGRAKGLGNLYQAEEQWFKLAVFKHQKELGKSAEEAVKIAQDALFDYSEVPKSIKAIRESVAGLPFVTFAYKAMPKAAQSFMENPTRFANLRRVNQAIEGLSSKEETKQEVKNFPDWMKDKSKEYLKIPLKDKYNRSQYLDLSYIYPWYSYAGIKPGSHPLISITTSITKNKDFLGNEIYKEYDTKEEKILKATKYAFQQIAPSLLGGYGSDKLTELAEKKPDYMGRTKEIPQTILDTIFGVKLQPIDLGEQKMWRRKEGQDKLDSLKKDLNSILRRPGYSANDKRKAMEKFQKKSQDILKELIGE